MRNKESYPFLCPLLLMKEGKGESYTERNSMESNIINEKARFTYRRQIERAVGRDKGYRNNFIKIEGKS